jgi:signal transduction histidine kinase/ligand-binding sensor domain-containing protein
MQKLNKYHTLLNRLLVLLVGIILCCMSVFAQTGSGEQGIPVQRDFLPAEYRASQQNFSIVSDKRGLIYVANFAGVLEYDGTSWRTILTTDRSKVNTLAVDASGTVFVGTRTEVGYLAPNAKGDMEFKSLNAGLKKVRVTAPNVISSFVSAEGAWFITADNILLWSGGKFKKWAVNGGIVSAFLVNSKIYVYLKIGGLKQFASGHLQQIIGGDTFSELVTVNTMTAVDGQNVLIGSNQGLFLMDRRGIGEVKANSKAFFADNIISCSIALKDGTFAFGTLKGGVAIISAQGDIKQIFSKKTSGLDNNGITYLYMDDSHGLWVAMQNGLTRIEIPSVLTFYNNLKNVNGDVSSVTRFRGNIYITTDQGVFYYDKTALQFKQVSGLQMAAFQLLVHGNKLIIATALGVYTYDGSTVAKMSDGYALCLYADGSDIYVGRLDGVSKLESHNGQLKFIGKISAITDEIRGIAKDAANNLWLQQPSKGLIRYNLSTRQATWYTTKKGLPFNSGNIINATAKGILIGTLKGVFVYNSKADAFKQVTLFPDYPNLDKNWVNKIVEDKDGDLLLTAGDMTSISLYKRAGGKYVPDNAALLPIHDQQIFCIYPDSVSGNIWMGSTNTLVSYNTKIVDGAIKVKHTLIRSVILNTDSVLFNGTYFTNTGVSGFEQSDLLKPVLTYKQNNLYFSYSSPLSNGKNGVTYRYILENFETDSSKWVNETEKEYSNLPPGSYTFHVKSKNIFGTESPEATYSFTIKKPFYQTVTAYIIYVLFLGCLVVLFVRIRSQQLLKEKKKLEDLILQRTEEVVSQKEEIETQSAELANKNDELEKINLIVKSINAEIDFGSLMQTILEKTRVIKGAEKAAMLVHDPASGMFRFKASFGYDTKILDGIQLGANETETRYLSDAEEIYEDIFFVKSVKSIHKDTLFSHVNKAKSILIMLIRLNNKIEAFLILENWQKQNAFVERDFSLLKNLKEHFIAAFIKTTLLEEVQNTLTNLKETQDQLIRHEKMASVGQLTKGIVDRILNPLNYINNFSLLSKNLVTESEELMDKPEMSADDLDEIKDILNTVKFNLQKVNDHGSSATRIVKGMEKILKEKSTDYIETDINKLVATNLEMAHTELLKEQPDAKVEITTNFDPKSEKQKILPNEMSTVLMNLLHNAFYVVTEKARITPGYIAKLTASTTFADNSFQIKIWDNGKGINAAEMKQLFQPFFTTKPTAKGTGLGLYLSQDIVKEHKGEITVNTKEGEFTEFTITIPKKV